MKFVDMYPTLFNMFILSIGGIIFFFAGKFVVRKFNLKITDMQIAQLYVLLYIAFGVVWLLLDQFFGIDIRLW